MKNQKMKNQKMKNRKITDCLTNNVVLRTPLKTIGHVRASAPDSVDENKKIPAPQLAAGY
jgi:hypothetical protein